MIAHRNISKTYELSHIMLSFWMAFSLWASPAVLFQDRFGREISEKGILLVDWEGYLANPAFRLRIATGSVTQLPIMVTLQSKECRIYFNLPSLVDESGSSKVVELTEEKPVQDIYLAIWPDRNGENEVHQIEVTLNRRFGTEHTSIPVYVLDQDRDEAQPTHPTFFNRDGFPFLNRPSREPLIQFPFPYVAEPIHATHPAPFTVTLDFSKDTSGLFDDPQKRKAARQAADDWSYFIAEMGFSTVGEGQETTRIYQSIVDQTPKDVKNLYAYHDFLIYVTGGTSDHSFSSASGQQFQHGPIALNRLRRSAHTMLVNSGEGFLVDIMDSKWWNFLYEKGKPLDLYSIALHEFGHAFAFYETYPIFSSWDEKGAVDDIFVEWYHLSRPPIERETSHLVGKVTESGKERSYATIDRVSMKGAYGTTVGVMPHRRWILTKLDLLIAQGVGYKLKSTSAFEPLTVEFKALQIAKKGRHFHFSPLVKGGVPSYFWRVEEGSLPKGLALDTFSGRIDGTIEESGIFDFILSVQDSDDQNPAIYRAVHLSVE